MKSEVRNKQRASLENPRRKNWWRRYWLVVVLGVYFMVSLIYQSTSVVRETLTIKQADYNVIGPKMDYQLSVHYPQKIPLEPIGTPGRPLTLWAWSETVTEALSLGVALTFSENHVIFTDAEGQEQQSLVTVPVAGSEPAAERVTTYVGRRRSERAAGSAALQIDVVNAKSISGPTETPIVRLERAWGAALRRGAELFLNTPALSWVSVAVAIYTIWQERRAARRQKETELRERIVNLPDLPKQRIWRSYWALWEDIEKAGLTHLRRSLRHAWQEIDARYPSYVWQYQLRAWLSESFSDWRERETLDKAYVALYILQDIQAFSKSESEILLNFLELSRQKHPNAMVASQNGFSLEKYLCLQLQAFRLLGLESRALMAKTLKNQSPITKGLYDALWKHWYADGGAAGRYLLRVSENLDLVSGSTLGDALRDWIRDEMPSPGYLWPASLPALPDAQAVALNKFHPKENDFEITWLTPFGPEKAEREGRLPVRDMGDKLPGGFFWDGHPLKKEIWAQRDGIVVAPPGSGRTTLLWMARHEYRFAGRHPALSLYIALQSLPTEETLFQKCRRVFFETVISTLSEDPFWLLDTQTQYRSEIIGFLLFEAGGHEPLARHIIFQGLSSGRFSSLSEDQQRAMRARERADQDLLIELCYQHTIQEIEGWQDLQALITMTRLPMARARGCTPQNFPTFFWFDVQTADPDQEQIFIQRLHRNEVLHRLGNIKVFLPVPLPDRTVPRLEWSESLLQSLLEYRWKRADLTRSDWRKLIEALEISDPVAHLIAKAKGSPQHLIRAGNQMLRRWGNYLSSERATEGEIG